MFSLRLGSTFALEFILGDDFRLRLGDFEINRHCIKWGEEGADYAECAWHFERIRAWETGDAHSRFHCYEAARRRAACRAASRALRARSRAHAAACRALDKRDAWVAKAAEYGAVCDALSAAPSSAKTAD